MFKGRKLFSFVFLSVITGFVIFSDSIDTAEAFQIEGTVALICGDVNCPKSTSDIPIFNYMCGDIQNPDGNGGILCPNGLVERIEKKEDNSWQNQNVDGYAAIVISESVDSSKVGWLKNKVKGIVTLEGANWDEFNLANSGDSKRSFEVEPVVEILDSHFIVEPFLGGLPMFTNNNGVNTGFMSSWASDAKPLALFKNDKTKAALLAIEKGDTITLPSGEEPAKNRRVFLAARNLADLNADGQMLFDRSLEWAFNIDMEKSSQGAPLTSELLAAEETMIYLVCKNSSCNSTTDLQILNYLCPNGEEQVTILDKTLFRCLHSPQSKLDIDYIRKYGQTDELSFGAHLYVLPFRFQAAIVSESVDSSQTAWLKHKDIGMLTLEGQNWDELGLAYGGSTTNTVGSTDLIIDNSIKDDRNIIHYITKSFQSSKVQLSTNKIETGYMSDWDVPGIEGTEPKALAVFLDDPNKAAVLIVEKNDYLRDGVTTAKDRRVFLAGKFFDDLTNSFGKIIFERALIWASHKELMENEKHDVVFTIYNLNEPHTNNSENILIMIRDTTGPFEDTRSIAVANKETVELGQEQFNKPLTHYGNGIYTKEIRIEPSFANDQFMTDMVGANENDEIVIEIMDGTELYSTSFMVGAVPECTGTNCPPKPRAWQQLPDPKPCNQDNDGDGICDEWELGDRIEVPAGNNAIYTFYCNDPLNPCDSSIRDIFLEIDFMQGHKPDYDIEQMLMDAFSDTTDGKDVQVRLHVVVDEEIMPHMDRFFWIGSDNDDDSDGEIDNPGFLQYRQAFFGTKEERDEMNSSIQDWWENEGFEAKKNIFHYALFVHRQAEAGFTSSSGRAEGENGEPGDDIIISMGPFANGVGSTDQQAGTLMHELGHNLNLEHGGNVDVNCKPNYFSVMSYTKQFSTFDVHFPDYSRSDQFDTLHETGISETADGMDPSMPPEQEFVWHIEPNRIMKSTAGAPLPINWNGDEIMGNSGMVGVDFNNIPGCESESDAEELTPHNDWQNIIYDFKIQPQSISGRPGWDDSAIITGSSGFGSSYNKNNSSEHDEDYNSEYHEDENELGSIVLNKHRLLRIDYLDRLINSTLVASDESSKQTGLNENEDKFTSITQKVNKIKGNLSCEFIQTLEEQINRLEQLKDKIKIAETSSTQSSIVSDIIEEGHANGIDIYPIFDLRKNHVAMNFKTSKTLDENFKALEASFPKKIIDYDAYSLEKLEYLITNLNKTLDELKERCKPNIAEEYKQDLAKVELMLRGDKVAEAVIFLEKLNRDVNSDTRIKYSEKEPILDEINSITASFETEKNFKPTSMHEKGSITNLVHIKEGAFFKAQNNECDSSGHECIDPIFLWLPYDGREVTWTNEDSYRYRITCYLQQDGIESEKITIPGWLTKGTSISYEFEKQGVYECVIKPTAPNTKEIISYIGMNEHAAPEFDNIILLVLLAGIASVIAISTKINGRLGILATFNAER